MNGWLLIAAKVGEKILANQMKQAIWNNPNTSIRQKQMTSNLIDAASLTKDVYDIVSIASEMNSQKSVVKEETPNE